jgi:F0F1-type ATP synthase assembly protein I
MQRSTTSGEGSGGSPWVWMARLSAILTILPASMGMGWVMGYFLIDEFLHIYPWGSLGFTLLGAGAGFYEIIRIVTARRVSRNGR